MRFTGNGTTNCYPDEVEDFISITVLRCPPIPFTAAETQREAFLWRLAAAFQALMDEARNPCALKGGTALRFQAGLSRPSTDLDFEDDQRLSVGSTIAPRSERTES